MKDEYKSINALWARWIFLNRRFFISNFQNGCKKFVEDYYEMIHLTAGWDALRFLLLALLANRFLTGHDVAVVLKYYESLTGMDYWY
ncbi:hypothetical protein FISHEDRAFT_53376 [Fistulina hepatica ATCC 64428]|nr:hypothetical protein FISHEDRAFT_53376 [Fistulina hepatica ATCC 64428]